MLKFVQNREEILLRLKFRQFFRLLGWTGSYNALKFLPNFSINVLINWVLMKIKTYIALPGLLPGIWILEHLIVS